MIRPFVFALGLFLASLQSSSHAQTISIATGQNANQTEQLGFTTNYVITGTPQGYGFATWSFRQNDGDCVSAYGGGVSNPNYSVNYGTPGEFDIQAVIPWVPNSSGVTKPNLTQTKHVVIPKPAVSKIINNGASSPYCSQVPSATSTNMTATTFGGQPGIWTCFVLTSGGKPMGPQLTNIGLAHRRTLRIR